MIYEQEDEHGDKWFVFHNSGRLRESLTRYTT